MSADQTAGSVSLVDAESAALVRTNPLGARASLRSPATARSCSTTATPKTLRDALSSLAPHNPEVGVEKGKEIQAGVIL
ncbi:MAG: hypothetical protein ACM35G_15945, partial [Planctomycetaceae bacterium]